MGLTPLRDPRNADDFPAFQLFILAIIRLAEPIALTSIFPYAFALVKRFEVGDSDNAATFAGLLISAFALAEAAMGMYWGGLSDRVGRRPVVMLGCMGTLASMLMLGFATNIWFALVARVLGGLLNGNVGVVQTMVNELVKNPAHEPRAYAIMPFVWSIGTIIGPAIGGTLADPHSSFPDAFPVGSLFERYPYLLPNLVCAVLLLISLAIAYFMLEETHPDKQPFVETFDAVPADTETTPLIASWARNGRLYVSSTMSAADRLSVTSRMDASRRLSLCSHADDYGSLNGRVSVSRPPLAKNSEKASAKVFNRRMMLLMVALSIYTYHAMTWDHLLPVFFEDDRLIDPSPRNLLHPLYAPGGLGLSLRAVGTIMAVQGFVELFFQLVVFPVAASRVGVHRLFLVLACCYPVVYVLIPPLLYVPERWLFPAVYACLSIRNLFTVLLYPLLLILIKNAAPCPATLGRVNGLAVSAGALCRMAAPIASGYVYTVGRRADCTAVAWWCSSLVALAGAVQAFSVPRDRAPAGVEGGGAPRREEEEAAW